MTGPLFDTLVRTINLIKIRHTEAPVFTVAFSPNGTRIASAGDDGIRLWDAATGRPIGKPMEGHRSTVSVCLFARRTADRLGVRDQTAPALGCGHRAADRRAVDAAIASGNRCVQPRRHPHRLHRRRRIRLWDAATGQPIGEPMTESTGFASVYSVAFSSPDGVRIAAESVDGTIRLWNATTGQTLGQPVTVQTVDAPEGCGHSDGSNKWNPRRSAPT